VTPAGVHVPRGLALRCAVEGRDAGAGGLPWRACPYDGGRPYSLRWWLRGYVGGRSRAGLPMPALDVDVDEDVPSVKVRANASRS